MMNSSLPKKRRHRVRLALVLVMLVVFSFSGCASTDVTPISSDDPFSAHLNDLSVKRLKAEHWLIASAASLAAGAAAGTTFSTLHSLNIAGPPVSTIGVISSYTLSILGAAAGIVWFSRYTAAVNEYLQTLRLETQYYNLVSPPGGGS